MLDADELEELRSLQARAYGREASLTDADAVRLRALEERRVAPGVEPVGLDFAPTADTVSPPDRGESSDDAGSASAEAGDQGVEAAAPDAAEGHPSPVAEGSPGTGESARSLWRAHWRPAVLAVAALLVVGVGVGWLLFGRSAATPVALSAQQQEWQSALIAGGRYDPGSVRALAVEQGAVISAATKDDGAITCLLVATSASALPTCQRTETVEGSGLFGAVTVESKDDIRRELNVQMMFTASGEPAVSTYTAEYGPGTTNGVTYANAGEAEKAKRIAAQGFEINSLWVIGYDGEVPVWTGMALESFQTCLIYDGSDDRFPRVCADALTLQEQSATLVLNVVDEESGEVVRLEVPTWSDGSSSLMITREGGADGAGGDGR